MNRIASLLILLAVAGVCAADTPGTTNADGYLLGANGYYTYGASAQLYYRSLVNVPGYWSYGNYYPGKSYYQYIPYTAPAPAAPKVEVPPYQAGWQERVADAIAKKNDYNSYLQAIRILDPGVAAAGAYGVNGSAYSVTNFGVNGSTSYGVGQTYNSALPIPPAFNTLDLNLLYQAAAQNTQSALRLGSDANAGFSGLVGQAGQAAGNVAKIQAEAAGVAQVGSALFNAVRAGQVVQGFNFSLNPGQPQLIQRTGPGPDHPGTVQRLQLEFAAVAQQKCAACHSGATAKGGLNVFAMSPQQEAESWRRILLAESDPDFMPRGGKRLSQDEARAFLHRPRGPAVLNMPAAAQ